MTSLPLHEWKLYRALLEASVNAVKPISSDNFILVSTLANSLWEAKNTDDDTLTAVALYYIIALANNLFFSELSFYILCGHLASLGCLFLLIFYRRQSTSSLNEVLIIKKKKSTKFY